MREHLYQGKRIDNGEWVQGSYVRAHKYLGGATGHFIYDIYGERRVLVAPETISEFTGLYDRNGKRIFEGAIVSFVDDSDKRHIGVVKWSDEKHYATGFMIWRDDESEYYGYDGAFDLGIMCFILPP